MKRQVVGKAFKKEARLVMSYVAGLNDSHKLELKDKLQKEGKVNQSTRSPVSILRTHYPVRAMAGLVLARVSTSGRDRRGGRGVDAAS